ncbi:hypothetical protein SHKM778_35740 [Streptomyces sp. KM77-8]|uniref:Uncharacterized protein n=1 Tax=Streptomyces haneummycinicus TaxID=3074435 RepID=A0AAT9HIE6_9ACTN
MPSRGDPLLQLFLGGRGGTLSMTARVYASVWSSPGTTRHSYVHRPTAVSSSWAHSRNHTASPRCRPRCRTMARSTPNASSSSSARSTNTAVGIRRPCSTEATEACE